MELFESNGLCYAISELRENIGPAIAEIEPRFCRSVEVQIGPPFITSWISIWPLKLSVNMYIE